MKYRPKQDYFLNCKMAKNKSTIGFHGMQKWDQKGSIKVSITWRHQMVRGPSTMLNKGPK